LRENEIGAPSTASSLLTGRQPAFGAFPCIRHAYLIFSFQSGAEIEKVVRSSSLWAFVRLIGQMKKKPLSDKDKAAVELLTEKVRSLID